MEAATPTPDPATREALKGISRLWWLWIVFGLAWVTIGVVILQFDSASITTVGVIVLIAGVIALISPENTFAALADILGFLFLIVGVFWIIQSFATREINELWWIGLLAGVLMVILAFWTGGQFFIEKEYLLLVFAGIWSLMQGFIDLVRAFQIK